MGKSEIVFKVLLSGFKVVIKEDEISLIIFLEVMRVVLVDDYYWLLSKVFE